LRREELAVFPFSATINGGQRPARILTAFFCWEIANSIRQQIFVAWKLRSDI